MIKQNAMTIAKNILNRVRGLLDKNPLRGAITAEQPMRFDLFNMAQFEAHAQGLAQSHKLSREAATDMLLARLDDNGRVLRDTCNLLLANAKADQSLTPAAEWLLDNFYLIEEHVLTTKRHFPKGYSRGLPRLQDGPSANLPRAYDIALEVIAHSDARIDGETLTAFILAYQKITPLKLGELWAVPIMLRLALIENLRRIATRVAATRLNRNLAASWADQMIMTAGSNSSKLILVLADMARSNPPLEGSFVAELVRRLQGQGPALTLPLNWLEQHLTQSSTTVDQLVQSDIRQQAADQLSVANSIGSLRLIGLMNWKEFVEGTSVVEQSLRNDPTHHYAAMDFDTRDLYRHIVEKTAKNSGRTEGDVAQAAIALARRECDTQGQTSRMAHVGYFLIGKGRMTLEEQMQTRPGPFDRARRVASRAPFALFLGGIAFITLAAGLRLGLHAAHRVGYNGLSLGIFLCAVIGFSQLAVTLVNWLATLLVSPYPLPRLDFAGGVPNDARSLVVIPTLITSATGVDSLVTDLEVRYLANKEDNVHFGLLTDFADAATATLPSDAALLAHAQGKIEALNRKYGGDATDVFYLFHRPRRWNARERTWMGHERKRGKLADLNALLRGGETAAFALIVGDIAPLAQVKYVITLDTDTQLPRDAAREFAGVMAHPLNRPYFDETLQRVTEGYGIVQPRVAVSVNDNDNSAYAALMGGETGIDPYTRAVSDVYQDMFGEGSFIGKGIYDVDAFEHALKDKFPENTILSHDLLEGAYVRSGLLSDVQLYEEYPARYASDVSRRHRWIRGDWQIAGWLWPNVPGTDGKRVKNPLSALSRWKIFDNLRRSVVPQALVALLIVGWSSTPTPVYWTCAVAGVYLIPTILSLGVALLRKPKDVSIPQHLGIMARSAGRGFSAAGFNLLILAHEAIYNTDAILRVSWRMAVSHRRLLEWRPSSETNKRGGVDVAAAYRSMASSPLLAAVIAVYLVIVHPFALLGAAPFLLAWATAPAVAWFLSRPTLRKRPVLSDDQSRFLGKLTRRTWAFFEHYVGAGDNHLPPDNVQEAPVFAVAHRTSPTNIGLSLLASVTAGDFGYIPMRDVIKRVENTFDTLVRLEKYNGHFYNWYDTVSLVPLYPKYVSTVDSGNLAGHLLTLRAALNELPGHPVISPRVFHGLRDIFDIVVESMGNTPAPFTTDSSMVLDEAINDASPTILSIRDMLEKLSASLQSYADRLTVDNDTRWWTQAMLGQMHGMLEEMRHLLPWVFLDGAATFLLQIAALNTVPTLQALSTLDLAAVIEPMRGTMDAVWLDAIVACQAQIDRRTSRRLAKLGRLAEQAGQLSVMEQEFLYDRSNHLLAIGYNVSDRRRDNSFYDLLASEARLTTFVGVASGQLPQDAWFALGRQTTLVQGKPMLMSWSGSMFEYLMPLLVMPNYDKTLLDQTYKAIITRQIAYGAERNVPWGISESGYYTFDAHLNYQYKAFGVPGTGIKRGLADDLVIAPYATMMAMMVDPEAATVNLQRLTAAGFSSKFGLYEAVDYTASRVPRGKDHAVVQSFMVHHQGMGFLALAYHLLDRPMQRRFAADPMLQSTLLLLQERVPQTSSLYAGSDELATIRTATTASIEAPIRVIDTPHTRIPEVQLLSNGRYHVAVTNAGGSSSRWNGLAVTRWREDTTRDNWGTFCYIRDVSAGNYWSTAYQPTMKQGEHYEAIFSDGRAEFRRRDGDIETHTEIVVSPEDDIELRRTRLTNRSRTRKTIEVTSYAEVVMAPQAADMAHPAFSNLFVQTEILQDKQAILCTRRPRALGENPPYLFHLMAVRGNKSAQVSYETDRMKFIGRGNTVAAPQALQHPAPLSNSQGSVLDPIVAIRHQIVLEPDQSVTVDMVSGAAPDRAGSLHLIDKYRDVYLADRVPEMAWTHSQVVLRQLNATDSDARLYMRLASSVMYANNAMRADTATLVKNRRGQSGLWGYAISGDLPIVLLKIKSGDNIHLVRQMVQAHTYWRLKGLAVELVIWNEDNAGYRQLLQEQILGLIANGGEANMADKPGGIFVRSGDQISAEDRVLIQSVARVILSDADGTLADQINRPLVKDVVVPRLRIMASKTIASRTLPLQKRDTILDNGLGGFSPDGQEYIITTRPGQRTPAPWSNVLANPQFGCVISESGQSYTWSENAHSFRLTPWHNDPVSDLGGEAFFLRDETTGEFWSPTARPAHSANPYVTRHGFGYSVFEHVENGIRSELTVYVAIDAPIKFSVFKIRNDSGRARSLSATGYVEWVLGDLRAKTGMHVTTEIDHNTGAIFAKNAYNTEFAERVAFFDVDDAGKSLTADRTEFIGRNGSLQNPAAMAQARLSGRVGAGLDACAAFQVPFDLAPGEEREIVFKMGVTTGASIVASSLVRRFRGAIAARGALEAVNWHWKETLGAVRIETPDVAINMLANGWLMYQTITCRLWARSGYYQSGGAFGFRDQLQDAMAVVHTKPDMLRQQLLLHAAHQFLEGDVQHWWHPPFDRGVRTKCSDDYLWLPLAMTHYLDSTGDTPILREEVSYLEGRELNHDEESYYDLPHRSQQTGTMYDHCVRAIERGLRFGTHGLPLIGSCDWNDGMDKVGEHGRGESVWLAFFLYDILLKFKDVARNFEDEAFAQKCTVEAEKLRQNIEANGWDGEWYRRAYFDDGAPLGSAENDECQIDSLSQSWAVLTGAGSVERAQSGMRSLDKRLVRRDVGIIQLLDPPFDKTTYNPGYIRGYVPGVRENGGQYTHAAIWTVMAFAKMGDRARTWELLQMINPVNHGRTPAEVAQYRVEPYVVCADVYGVDPHAGRGGWTWYTGSSGWMYRLIIESVLGLKLDIDTLHFTPCLPPGWTNFKLSYRYRNSVYNINVTQNVSLDEEIGVILDGVTQNGAGLMLVDDQEVHAVDIRVAPTDMTMVI